MNDDKHYENPVHPSVYHASSGDGPKVGVSSTDEPTRLIDISNLNQPQGPAAQPKPSCLVLVYAKDELGKKFEIQSDQTSIGRSEACNVCVKDESVSRVHCYILRQPDGSFRVRDNRSTNGTMVNTTLVTGEHPIHDGDQLHIGGVMFKFLSGDNLETNYYNAIYELTNKDGLTGIYNKRYYMETLTREMNRARRYGRALSMIMFDIDFFKKINDTYGHLAGDMVLSSLARTISSIIRKEDIFARYGGEEFSIILPEITIENARFFAEKIRRVVEMTQFYYQSVAIPVTISLGIATFDLTMDSVEAFIRAADENLYVAKRSGRNCSIG